jgi:tyrosine-protein phosphatase non-receptor type 23
MARDESVLNDLTFEWREVYSDKVIEGDITYEMLSILLNIAILFVELGASDTRGTDAAMKTCCTYFQCAVFAFDSVIEQTAQTGVYRSKDMSHDVVSFMSSISMAQGQECILEKSICDSRKPGIIAKISAQVSEYYSSCIMILLQSSLSAPASSHHYSVQDVVGSREFKNWKKYCEFKISYFSCLSSFFMGISCGQSQKVGESIAWFNSCHERLMEATKHCKGIDRHEWTSSMTDAIKSVTEIINKKSEAAKKENDFIFHEMIPSAEKLTAVKGVSLVKAIPFSVTDPDVIEKDILGNLVPLEAYVTTSVYTEKKDKLLRDIGIKIEDKNEDLESFLSALNLPATSTSSSGVSLRPKISPLPDELIDICAVLSLKDKFLETIEESIYSLDKKRESVQNMMKKIQKMIDDEKEAEQNHQMVNGKPAESTLISNIEKDLQDKRDKLFKAASSDHGIKTSFQKCLPDLQEILRHHKSARDLNALLPEPGNIPMDEDNIRRLEEILNKTNEMKRQRAQLENELKEAVRKDDVLSKVLMNTDDESKVESLFTEELKKFDKTIELINMNLNAQENIKAALIKANADYAPTRKAIIEVEKKRRERTREMIDSYETVLRLESSARTASAFYDKLSESLTSLESNVKSVTQLLSDEKAKYNRKPVSPLDNMRGMSTGLPASRSSVPYSAPYSTPPTTPKLKDYLMNRPASSYPGIQSQVSYSSVQYRQPIPLPSSAYSPIVPPSSSSYDPYGQYASHSSQTVGPITSPVSGYNSQYSQYSNIAPQQQPPYYPPVSNTAYTSYPTNGSSSSYETPYPGQNYSQTNSNYGYNNNSYGQQQQPTQGYGQSQQWQQQQQPHQQPYQVLRTPTTDLLSDPLETYDQNPVLSPTPASQTQ